MSGTLGIETYGDSSSLKYDTFSFCHQCVLGETFLGGATAVAVCEDSPEDRVGLQADLCGVTGASPSVIQGETGVATDRTSNTANLGTVNKPKESPRCYFALGLDVCVPACLCMQRVCVQRLQSPEECVLSSGSGMQGGYESP